VDANTLVPCIAMHSNSTVFLVLWTRRQMGGAFDFQLTGDIGCKSLAH